MMESLPPSTVFDKIDKRRIVFQAWTGNPSVPDALVFVLLKLPNVKFVIVTLAEDGYMILERVEAGMLAYFWYF